MLQTRWRKVLRDLWSHKARTILVIAAITVGVFAVGLVASAQTILLRELDRGYQASQAASARLYAQPFDDDLVARIGRIPQVDAAEGRRTLRAQVIIGPDETRELVITAVTDFTALQLDKVFPITGDWPPRTGDILVEQLSLDYLQANVGDVITLKLGDDVIKEARIAGLVHDANVPSAEITESAFAYVTVDTLDAFGMGRYYTELRYRVPAAHSSDKPFILAANEIVKEQIEKSGRLVFATDTPTPGEHWAQAIIETLIMLFVLFGGLTMILSGFLVVNTISALLTQQIKQIGVMKMVGARRRQIMSMYFVMVVSYGLAALAIGVPLSIFAAQRIIPFATNLLNVQVVSDAVPAQIIFMQMGIGLLAPLVAAIWPVFNGVRITTHKALNSLGIDAAGGQQSLVERFFAQIQQALPLQRPFIISLRNTIRKKGRLALTLATLIMGTALFIAILSVRASVGETVDNFLRYHRYDVGVNLSRPYRAAQVEPLARQLPGVVAVESWLNGSARRIYADDSASESIAIVAAPADTQLIEPQLEDGRWLQLNEGQTIVINTDFRDEHPDLRVGDEVVLEENGRQLTWRIVGIVPTAASGPTVYVDYATYSRAMRSIGQATSLKIITAQHDAAYQNDIAAQLVNHLESAGIRLTNSRTTASVRAANEYRFNIVVWFLIIMAVLLATVGALGLTTTMSINILERIREIGVLRAIGASDGAVRLIVLGEGVVIGLISWVIGSAVALPLSRILSQQVGLALLGIPLDYNFALDWAFIWLLLIILLAIAASLGPAHSASKLTIREVLAYE